MQIIKRKVSSVLLRKPAALLLRTFYRFLVFGLKNCLKRKEKKEREFFGWTDGHAREQKRQGNGNKTFYFILLKVTARLREHNKYILI